MSNNEEGIQMNKDSKKNININLQINNMEDYNCTDENNNLEENELNDDFRNIIKNQKSINLLENAPKIENEISNNNSVNSKNINTNNNLEEEEENNIINNEVEGETDNKDEKDYINYEQEQESINKINNENSNNEDEELPLITLNFISECQCCKTSFDDIIYKPYLLKCGHFFCIKCIKEYFTDKNGIKCPSDGLIAKSLNELTFLNNLIPKEKSNNNAIQNTDNNILPNNPKIKNHENESNNSNSNSLINDTSINNNFQNFCPIHKNQKLSHIVCDTNEIICVYCAFESFKKNPKREIKELSSQITEFANDINEIISSNQNEVLNLHNSLKKIKNNKETEESSINNFFDCLIEYIKEKQNEFIDKVNEIFNDNTKKIGDKLEDVTDNIEKSEKIKNLIDIFNEKEMKNENNVRENYNEILSKYLILKQKMRINKQKLELNEYKFKHTNEEQISKKFLNLGEIIFLDKKNNINNKSFHLNDEKDDNKNLKKIIFNKKDFTYNNDLGRAKEKVINMKKNNTFDNPINMEIPIKPNDKRNNFNYIILDDLSLNKNNINNNNYLNNPKNGIKFEQRIDSDEDKIINKEKIKNNKFKNKFDFKIKRKSTYTINRNKNRNMLYMKSGKDKFNYIDYPNFNTNLNNYCLLSKYKNDKRDKERNNITVNNYEVHQTLKNSFNNNFNYGQNYNNSNYLNKIIDFNNLILNDYNANSIKTQTNRNKFSLINNKKYNKIIKFK